MEFNRIINLYFIFLKDIPVVEHEVKNDSLSYFWPPTTTKKVLIRYDGI